MVNIGKYNTLKVNRMVDFGAYLSADNETEILLPAKFVPEDCQIGDEIEVFVYNDSEDRLIATTQKPYATVGQFAFLQVNQVNRIGAFLDWGLEAKELLVPFSEQKVKMVGGGVYLVYIYLDNASQRVVASAKIEKFLGNVMPQYKIGQQVQALVYQHTPLGYKCIVDDLHMGLLYSNELFKPLEIESTIPAYVKQVRDDGKIDLTLSDRADRRTNSLANDILQAAKANGGSLDLNDKSEPQAIQETFACSKKDFKKAIGHLYKDHKIEILPNGIKVI